MKLSWTQGGNVAVSNDIATAKFEHRSNCNLGRYGEWVVCLRKWSPQEWNQSGARNTRALFRSGCPWARMSQGTSGFRFPFDIFGDFDPLLYCSLFLRCPLCSLGYNVADDEGRRKRPGPHGRKIAKNVQLHCHIRIQKFKLNAAQCESNLSRRCLLILFWDSFHKSRSTRFLRPYDLHIWRCVKWNRQYPNTVTYLKITVCARTRSVQWSLCSGLLLCGFFQRQYIILRAKEHWPGVRLC